jgi:hypothetical protein
MKKLFTNNEDLLRSLALYWLFKNANTLDAFALAEKMGLSDDVELKSWLECGCKVNWSWIDQHGDLSHLLMSQHAFGNLVHEDAELHAKAKIIRIAASQRWSNDWKKIDVKILTAKSLSMVKPTEKELDLSWSSAVSACAILLYKVGMPAQSDKISLLPRLIPFSQHDC